jgi:hypothetical protein
MADLGESAGMSTPHQWQRVEEGSAFGERDDKIVGTSKCRLDVFCRVSAAIQDATEVSVSFAWISEGLAYC